MMSARPPRDDVRQRLGKRSDMAKERDALWTLQEMLKPIDQWSSCVHEERVWICRFANPVGIGLHLRKSAATNFLDHGYRPGDRVGVFSIEDFREERKRFMRVPLEDLGEYGEFITGDSADQIGGPGLVQLALRAKYSGQTPPKHEDNERTIDELRSRIRKTVAFAESVMEAQYAGASERKIRLSWAPGKVIGGEDYLLQMTIPNTFFHIAMAYAILRHNGVDIGKRDFRGPINWIDA
jgi:hypothetical protein